MEQLEKVERLQQRANITYEEAKEALEACGWDLLDAMVYLEKQGKVKGPSQESYSTDYEKQMQYVSVREKVQENEDPSENFFEKVIRLGKLLFEISIENSFRVSRRGEEVFQIPVLALVLVLLLIWKIAIPALIIALFFDCRYSFCGKDDLDKANKAMEKAGEFADKVKDEYEKNSKGRD